MSTNLITLLDGTVLSDAQVREYLVTKFPAVSSFKELVSPSEAVDAAFNAMRNLIKEPEDEIMLEALRLNVHFSLLITA